MKENKKEKVNFLVSEQPVVKGSEEKGFNRERLKKPLVFGIMGILFAACLYLIFGGDSEKETKEALSFGINDAVPQASDDVLPTDKGKAYEQEMLREKEQQKREALMTLSDYWQSDSTAIDTAVNNANGGQHVPLKPVQTANPVLGSYRNMQRSLGTFYGQDNSQDVLRKENEKLKAELEEKARPDNRESDRLQLIEKSYQMAAKYFPGTVGESASAREKAENGAEKTGDYIMVTPQRNSVVSSLRRGDEIVMAQQSFTDTQTTEEHANGQPESRRPANSIRACIHQGVKLTGEGTVQLRLLQAAEFGSVSLPIGFLLTANAKFQTSRLQLQVVSIEHEGSIYPVNLTVYDLDGQKGLNLPYATEVTAVNSTLANMGNTAGGSFTINRNAGQQITSDAARGLIQGVSGYFSKKVKPQKASLNAGYQLFLVSKK
ncbi:MAG: conjugative transposon protein TraM [Flavobacterium psychrophilum]|nr:MAG: conjugative transposon protein TraM [Flavobacterium psychrophilum]